MSDKLKMPVILALGYFDSVHKGHQKVIEEAIDLAKTLGAVPTVFTFRGNLKALFLGENEKVVYTEEERTRLYKNLGVEEIYFAPVDDWFLSMDKLSFLDFINGLYEVKGYVSGRDYHFGKGGCGNVNDIKDYAKNHGQTYKIVDTVQKSNEKISTTAIKKILSDGNVEKAKEFLGRAYSVSGTVFSDRRVGHKLGFPTVNIKLDGRKHRLKDGVYAGHVEVFNKTYLAVINYGARPTFDLTEKLVEAHIIDFDGELYGVNLTLHFDRYIRGVIKFDDIEGLKKQLEKDVFSVKGENYD